MTVICFLAFLFLVLCVLEAFFVGVVWLDAKSMTPSKRP